MDIETVALDASNDRGALDAMSGRVVCVSMLIDDGAVVSELALVGEDERRIIGEFWRTLRVSDVIVGHNVVDFDLKFLRQRSWILGIEPSRRIDTRHYYTREVIDTLQLWTDWCGNKKGASLDALGSALGCGAKTGNAGNVVQWWSERNLEAIQAYCCEDVRLAYRVFCRLTASRNSFRPTCNQS
jgi:DNA polymerase elongation subunit (family B)